MKIELPVDQEKCNGCNKCFIICPDSLFVYSPETQKVYAANDSEFDEFEDRLGGALLNLIKEQKDYFFAALTTIILILISSLLIFVLRAKVTRKGKRKA